MDLNNINNYDDAVIACLNDMEEMGCIAVDNFFIATELNIDVDSLIGAYEDEGITASDYIKSIAH